MLLLNNKLWCFFLSIFLKINIKEIYIYNFPNIQVMNLFYKLNTKFIDIVHFINKSLSVPLF
jgi:hypothetical protein